MRCPGIVRATVGTENIRPVRTGSDTSRTTRSIIGSMCASARRFTKVTASPGGWRVETSDDALQARFVVIATGYDHDPDLPDWPGRQGYPGELIHFQRLPQPGAVLWARRSGGWAQRDGL